MSEKEILKILNSYTTDLFHSYKEDVILKAIRGLLDLYNKEKEKNKELEEKIMEQDLLITGLKEDRRIAIEEIQEQYYVSKDKIKEILRKDRDCMSLGYYSAYIGLIDDIQELLLEE